MNKLKFLALLFSLFLPVLSSAQDISLMGRVLFPGNESSVVTSGIYGSKNTFGMRANATVLALRANSLDPGGYPVSGFNYLKQISKYGDRDSVALYADNTSSAYKSWQIIKRGYFTATSVTSSQIKKEYLKNGMLIDTVDKPGWSGIIISIENNKIITNGWVNNNTGELGVPPQDSELIINPLTKIWGANFNIFLEKNGSAKAGVIQENGVVNNLIPNPNAVNGIDNVILPISKYGGTAAYLSRSASSGEKQQWLFGFVSQGAKNSNFNSMDLSAKSNTNVGFMENSSANSGLIFSGKNKSSSIEWRVGDKIYSRIDPHGKIVKLSYSTKVVKKSTKITDDYYRYIVDSPENIILTLPDTIPVEDGFTVEILNFSGHEINFISSRKINKKNNNGSDLKVMFIEQQWYII